MPLIAQQESIRITIPNNPGLLTVINQTVESMSLHYGFSREVAQTIVMASEEAVANVIRHAFPAEEEGSLDIAISKLPAGMEIAIADKGLPYDPGSITLDETTFKGFGSYLIGKIMDKVSFQNLGKEGKKLVLHKYFPNTGDVLPPDTATPQEEQAPGPDRGKNYEFVFRKFEPEDALEVARCAYECYGYTYAFEHIYYPERIVAFNASGDLISIVAEADDGELAGHIGLTRLEGLTGVYEIGLAMTKQKYRGGNIFSRLMDYGMEVAASMNLNTLYAQCVTTHTYSQSKPLKLGMLPSGLLPSYVPDDVSFRKIADGNTERTAILLVVRLFNKPVARRLYLPREYMDIAGTVCRSLAIEAEWVHDTDKDMETGADSLSNLVLNPNLKMGKLFIHHYGNNFERHIRRILQQIKQEKIQMAEAFINISRPDALLIIPALERLGFVFVGFLPGAGEGDMCMMQYLNGINPNLSKVKVLPEGERLLEFVKSQYEKI